MWGDAVAAKCSKVLAVNLPGEQWHNPWHVGETGPEASTRSALVLATVGRPLDDRRALYG